MAMRRLKMADREVDVLVLDEPDLVAAAALERVVAAAAVHDATCRAAIERGLTDEAVALYIRHHLDELPKLAAQLGGDDPERGFLALLALATIWVTPDGPRFHFDYTIDAAATTYVLSVTLDESGAVTSIDMES